MGFHRNMEGFDLHSPSYLNVKNETGSSLLKGRVVKLDGVDVDSVEKVTPIMALTDRVIGVMAEDVLTGATGKVAAQARLNGIDTSGFTVNDFAYSDVSGNLTVTDTGLFVGIVLVSDAVNGSLFVLTAVQGPTGPVLPPNMSSVLLVNPSVTTEHSTIALAIASAVSGDTILVGPGTYAESFVIPDGVSMYSTGGFRNTRIEGALTTGTRVTLGNNTVFVGFTVKAPTDSTPAILDNTATKAEARSISIEGQGGTATGILHSGTGTSVYRDVTLEAGGLADFIHNSAGGCVFWDSGIPITNPGTIGVAVRLSGGTLGLSSFSTFGTQVGVGVLISAGIFAGSALSVGFAGIGLHITGVSAFDCSSFFIVGTGTKDILVDPAATTATLHISSGLISKAKLDIPVGMEDFIASFLDESSGDSGLQIFGELSQGSHFSPAESSFGGGDSHTIGMEVLTNDNGEIGAWASLTAILKSFSGSTTQLLPGTGGGNSLYIGGDIKFPGIKVDTTVAAIIGSGSAVYEYWDGAAWSSYNIMSADADSFNGTPQQYGMSALTRVQKEQVRWDISSMTGWATKTLNGLSKFWARLRITTAITTIPEAEQMKLHTDRFEINGPGWREYFGYAEPIIDLPWHQRTVDEMNGFAPKDGTHLIAAASIGPPSITLSLKAKKNKLDDSALDGFGGIVQIPMGFDTSRPLFVDVLFYPIVATAGDVELQSLSVAKKASDPTDGTAIPVEQSGIETILINTQYVGHTVQFGYDVSQLVPGDSLDFGIFRDAQPANLDDTLAGAIHIETIRVSGTFWR